MSYSLTHTVKFGVNDIILRYLMLVVCGVDVVIVESRGVGVGAVEVGRRLLVSSSGSLLCK